LPLFLFLYWFPDGEFNVMQELLNLNPEAVQPDFQRTAERRQA
jgi:hypothetical protein